MKSLSEIYKKEIVKSLQDELHIKNIHDIPRIEKININVGIGTYMKDSKDYNSVIDNIARITGQRPVMIRAKKAISNFNKLKEGDPNGIKVTLRKERMYDFLARLIHIVLPRVRDFRGLSTRSFDGNGNYSIGLKEHTLFPEIKLDDVVKSHGIQITVVTSTNNDNEAKLLLEKFNFPFKKK
jgi:large subunit ribosomal protein L5